MVRKKECMNNKAQVTVFIIIALIILVVLILLFLRRGELFVVSSEANPLTQIKNCMSDSAEEAIGKLSVQGGSINPENYFMWNGTKIQYLCYASEYNTLCSMQKPMLKADIQKEIQNYVNERIDGCLSAVKDSLSRKGYSVTYKKPAINVELVLNNVIVNADEINLVISKSSTETYNSVRADIISKLYEFTMIASSIANLEAHYGDSETLNYMINYPSLKVEKKKQMDGTKIYVLTDRNANEKFIFASRSMALASGVTGN
jgi:hypothetical protein